MKEDKASGSQTVVFGVPIDTIGFAEVVERVERAIAEDGRLHIVTANPEMLMRASRDADFRNCLQSAELRVIDGVGLQWAVGRRLGVKPEKTTGIELSEYLLGLSSTKKWRIFLLGGTEEAVEACAKKLATWSPPPKIVGHHHGYLIDERTKAEALDQIRAARPDILLAGMGSPLQEKWIAAHKKELPAKVYIGVGGVFDVLSGKLKRAPVFYQKMGLEWLYRTLQEPSRLNRIRILPAFVIKTLISK